MADLDYAFIPKAQILASHAHANLDKDWGPFQSKDAALQSMPNTAVRKAGKKFGVVSTVGGVTTIEEYMFTKDNATDNDVVKLVLSSDDVTGTFDYTIGSTTSAQLSEAIGSNKIITIGTYIASVGRVGTSSSGYYVVCYTDEDGVFHKIVHGTSTSSVGTETTKEFAEVETINSTSELGFSGVIGGIKKYQGNTMLDLGGVSESGTLGNAIKHLISLGVHIDADDTNDVFAIKNINNETIGSITLGTNATNGAAELTFVAGSDSFTASLPNLAYDSSNQMLKMVEANGTQTNLIKLSNLQIKDVFDYTSYTGSAPTSVATGTYAIGDLALVEKQDTTTTPATVSYELAVVQSVTAGSPKDTIQWQPLGSINNVSLVADQVEFDNSTNGFEATDVQGAIEEVKVISESTSDSDLDVTDDDDNVLARFDGGHFKTKNFDSRDVDKIKQNVGLSEYEDFDDTKAYAIGDVVLHEGLFYKFISIHAAGVWNSSEVEQTNITKEFDVEHPVATSDYSEDLGFADNDGNVIASFGNGHIRTKNFDSHILMDKLTKLFRIDKFQGKTIGIIGDSISTYSGWLPSDISGYNGSRSYATYYNSSNLADVSMTWWYKMAVALGLEPSTQISNCAWSGSRVSCGQYNVNSASITDASPACSTRRVSDLVLRLGGNAPDIIIIFISCNDWSNGVAVGTWQISDAIPEDGVITTMRAAYALLLYKLHSMYPYARIFCCTNLDDYRRDSTDGWPSDNGNVTTEQWNQNIKEIASAFGCDIIDLHACGMNYSNMPQYCVDEGLHPNAAGHTLIANRVVSELLSKY